MDSSKKNFRKDRSCESCNQEGAALVSEDENAYPYYLCEPCMKFRLSRKMTSEEIITIVEKHWGIEANAVVGKCLKCGSDRIHIESIDNTRFFIRCGCTTQEGFRLG